MRCFWRLQTISLVRTSDPYPIQAQIPSPCPHPPHVSNCSIVNRTGLERQFYNKDNKNAILELHCHAIEK